MVRKEELTYKSRDRQTMLHAIKWIPEGQPVAILQIIHGMQTVRIHFIAAKHYPFSIDRFHRNTSHWCRAPSLHFNRYTAALDVTRRFTSGFFSHFTVCISFCQ